MSAIVPSRRVGMAERSCLGGLAREEAARPLGVADRAGGDRVDPDAERPPLDGQGAGQGVDRRLGRRDVELAGRAAEVERRADVQDRPAVRPRIAARNAARVTFHVPLASMSSTVPKPFGREVGRWAEEVARRGVDQEVEPAELRDHPRHRRLDLLGDPDVGDDREALAACECEAIAEAVGPRCSAFRLRIAVSAPSAASPSVIPRPIPVPPAGDQGHLAFEQAVTKDAHPVPRTRPLGVVSDRSEANPFASGPQRGASGVRSCRRKRPRPGCGCRSPRRRSGWCCP